MGVAHLLDEPGSASELAALGQARPLLRDDRLLLFGYTDYRGAEQDVLVRRVLLHLDVDVVDFIDPPIADIPQHNAGLTFDEAMTCLAVFARHEGLAGLIITEFNPDHGAEDGSTADALVRGLVGALTG
jgi:arginase